MKKLLICSLAILFSFHAFSQGDSGLIGRWTFNGDANDVSGHGLNGTVYNAALTAGISGAPNTAYYFNGTNSFISIPSDTIMNTEVHSFCVMVKPMGFYSGTCQGNAIIWRGNGVAGELSYQLEYFDNAYDGEDCYSFEPTQEVFSGHTGTETTYVGSSAWYYTPTIDSNTWYSVVLTYDGDTSKVYVDGILVKSLYDPCSFSPSGDSLIFGKGGDGPEWPYWLNGTIDEIRFYNRVLSPEEAAEFGDSLGLGKILPVMLYYDANNNCVRDSGEAYNTDPLQVRVDSNGTTIDTISATNGFYYVASGAIGDVYSFTPISTGAMTASCPSSATLNDTIVSGINPNKYMGLSCASGTSFDLGGYASFRTGRHVQIIGFNAQNTYCTNEAGTITLTFSPKYDYYSAYPEPDSVVGNVAYWHFDSLSYFTGSMYINTWLAVPDTWLMAGDTVISQFLISPSAGDVDTLNNVINDTDTVRSSFDPNEMEVSPKFCISSGVATKLRYTIGFENTGNDTAHYIYIMDTLSDQLDPKSLSIVSSSHKMNTQKWYDGVGHHWIYKFEFPYINLLDSSHHNLCDGMVTFDINTKASIAHGATINNRAGIYFDENPVVMTNSVMNAANDCSLGIPVVQSTSRIDVYPNPAHNVLNISSAGAIDHVLITNVMGQVVYDNSYNQNKVSVNITNLPSGVYMVKVNDSFVKKFVKE